MVKRNATPTKPKTKQPVRAARAPIRVRDKRPKLPASAVCALTDPFCSHSIGAKFPDSSSLNTIPFRYHSTTTLSTNVGGHVGALVVPGYSNSPVIPGTMLGADLCRFGGVDMDVANTARPKGVFDNVSKFRFISAGFIVRRISAPLTTSGVLRVRVVPNPLPEATFIDIDMGAFGNAHTLDIALQDAKEVVVMLPRNGVNPPETFYPVPADTTNGDVSDLLATGFSWATVNIDGSPADIAVVSIEFFVNIEVVPNITSSLKLVSTPPPPSNLALTTASAKVTSTVEAIGTKGLAAFTNYVEKRALQTITGLLL